MLGCVSVHISWNTISNLELRRSYNELRSNYTLTVDAIRKQLPSTNTVSLASYGWTSTNKLAIMSVIAHDMDRNWVLQEVQLAFDEVDSAIFSYFEMS
jgi:hypothetical protein